MKKNCTTGSPLFAFLVVGIVAISPALRAADIPDSEQVSKLLSEAKTQAFQLKEDASTMESYTRSNASWESHSAAVAQMKEHTNAAGRTLTKLEDARHTASPWQATAIDRIKPLLKEIATNTETVIDYINKSPKRLFMSEYKDYIETNSDVSSELAGLIADFVDYGNTKNRLERLTTKLELPGK
jgi:N-acyl-D-aspartate/D-glutamate deacylase